MKTVHDMWCFDTTTLNWMWINGTYVPQVNLFNYPGSRAFANSWITPDGSLWMFGGIQWNIRSNGFNYGNDLWKYTFEEGKWVCLSGNLDTGDADAVVAVNDGATSSPGSRYMSLSASDAEGNLYLYGGWGFHTVSLHFRVQAAMLADLWKFSPSNNQWTLIAGNPTENNCQPNYDSYGREGRPGSRLSGSMVFSEGKLILFGGIGSSSTSAGFGIRADFWSFDLVLKKWFWIGGSNMVNAVARFGPNPEDSLLGGLYAYGSALRKESDMWFIMSGRPDFENIHCK